MKQFFSGNTVTLYRVGDHVDISGGPMIGNSGYLGRRCSIMAVIF
jgi:large subunit ribosomal protein L39